MSKTITLGLQGNTTFTTNGGIEFSDAGGIFINGTAAGTFADVFIGPNNIVHQANNQTEKYSQIFGNYLASGFGANKDALGSLIFAQQNASNTDITVQALEVYTNDASGRTGNTVRGIKVTAIGGSLGTGQDVRGIDVNMTAASNANNYGIYVNGGGSTAFGMYSVGKIASQNDIIAFVSSDKRLKTNIKQVENPLDKLSKISGVSFEWKDGYDKRIQNKTNLGVIAQEVQKVIPEIVKERDNGMLAVKYDQLVPVLIEAVKDQQKQIDELKKKLEEL